MSLNGLDSPDVQEAYQTAIAEAGGWFLLKYVSRDSVELLGRGKGGVHEARTVVASQTEKSPLYGLIVYRRRRVLIKYIPDGTSRVLKARTAVHWQDVQDKFSPAETTVDITTPEGFNDTALAASFPLHTATPSASSSRLDEINEDEDEEDGQSSHTPTSPSKSTGEYLGSQRQRMDRRVDKSPPPAIHIRSDSTDKAVTSSAPAAARKPYISRYLVQENTRQQSMSSVAVPDAPSVTQYATVEDSIDTQLNGAGVETPKAATTPTTPLFKPLPNAPTVVEDTPKVPPKSTERYNRTAEVRLPNGFPEQQSTERPTTTSTTSTTISSASERSKYEDNPYDFSKWDIKPKQKLGPRPVATVEKTKRPTVASISSVPSTYRPTMKKPDLARPQSQIPFSSAVANTGIPKGIPAPPPIPDVPEYNPRPVSRGSIKSLPSHKSTAMTPDKIRLMKAVELRKKQLRKSNPQVGAFVPPPDEEVPAVPTMPEAAPKHEAEKEDQPVKPIMARETVLHEEQIQANKADSGIELEYEKSNQREDEKLNEIASQPSEPREVLQEPAPVATQPVEVLEAHSPRVDTPRETAGPSFERHIVQRHIVETTTKNELFSEIPTPRATTESESGPSTGTELPKDNEEDTGPTLPTSRHALPVDTAIRNQSIGPSRASEDGAAGVPTIVMQDGSRPLSALIKEARSVDNSPSEADSEERSAYETASSSSDLQIPERNIRRQNSDLARRRRGFVEPLHLDGDDEFDSDDEFMVELQSATLQEAKPVTVARSPVAHYFPRRPSNNSSLSNLDITSVRTVTVGDRASTPLLDYTDSRGRLSPDTNTDSPEHARSISTVSTEKGESMVSFKRSVSSGISKRIQALTEKSSQENSLNGTSSSSRPISPETSPNASSFKDPRQQSRSPPPQTSRTSSWRAMNRQSARISAYQSLLGSPPPQKSDSNTVWSVENDNQIGVESVSVTARIVRPTPAEDLTPSKEMEAALRPSQLVVSSHKRGVQSKSNVPVLERIDTNPKADESAGLRTTSPTVVRGSVDGAKPLHSASKFGRHKPTSPTADDFPVPPPNMKPQPAQPAPPNEDSAAHKESSKTSRFFKRMSNIGNKRRSTVAQSIASSGSPASERGSVITNNFSSSKDKQDMPPALTVGDLNIQFPDSLLWKRRIVEIDDAGYITFTISQAMEHQRGATKKYQLSEFKMPYIPDLDRQELPNSILLDFTDGTTLQLACEDSMTHRQVANILRSYWKAWTAV